MLHSPRYQVLLPELFRDVANTPSSSAPPPRSLGTSCAVLMKTVKGKTPSSSRWLRRQKKVKPEREGTGGGGGGGREPRRQRESERVEFNSFLVCRIP